MYFYFQNWFSPTLKQLLFLSRINNRIVMIVELCRYKYSNSLVITLCIFTFSIVSPLWNSFCSYRELTAGNLSKISDASRYVCITRNAYGYWGYLNRWNMDLDIYNYEIPLLCMNYAYAICYVLRIVILWGL